jgi:hypothetical protein
MRPILMPSPSDGPTDPALRARLRPLFAEWEEADMTNRVGKGDKPANLHRLIVAEQAIDAALAAAEAAPLDVDHPGEPHEFSMTCTKCGRKGMVHLSLITSEQRVTILDPDTETAGEAG